MAVSPDGINQGRNGARPRLSIGTRGSPLALAQAEEVRARLIAAHADLAEPGAIEIVVIKTTGDRITDQPLAEIGGKGLFTKEIEDALIDGSIDMAVHSMKDVPTQLPAGLRIGCLLKREDARDALIAREGRSIATLPRGAIVGSASLRRQAQLLALRPDLKIVILRGNVGTRLDKIARGDVAATLLALAGLKRLGRTEAASAILDVREMLPAVAQGAIGIEIRAGNSAVADLLAPLDHKPTARAIAAERACLAELEGSCRTPIAAYAEIAGDGSLHLRALIAKPDGSRLHRDDCSADAAEAGRLGREAGRRLKAVAGPGFLG